MPNYDYYCFKCKKDIEIFHSISDDSKRYCPDCNSELKRLISGGNGIIFKGTGFFQTDYKNREE